LSAFELIRCIIGDFIHPIERKFSVLNIFEWLCACCLILVVIYAILLLVKTPNRTSMLQKADPLSGWITGLGMVVFILIHLPFQIIDRTALWQTSSIFTINGSPFALPQLLILDVKALSHGFPIKLLMGIPAWGQLVLVIFTILAFAGFIAAILAILNPLNSRKTSLWLVITAAIGVVMLPLRFGFVPIERIVLNGRPLRMDMLFSMGRMISYSIFYYVVWVLLIALLVLGAISLSKRKQK
jgi:hypothetical protein